MLALSALICASIVPRIYARRMSIRILNAALGCTFDLSSINFHKFEIFGHSMMQLVQRALARLCFWNICDNQHTDHLELMTTRAGLGSNGTEQAGRSVRRQESGTGRPRTRCTTGGTTRFVPTRVFEKKPLTKKYWDEKSWFHFLSPFVSSLISQCSYYAIHPRRYW